MEIGLHTLIGPFPETGRIRFPVASVAQRHRLFGYGGAMLLQRETAP